MSKKALESPREFFTLANIGLNKAMAERLKVEKEGRTPAWEKEQYNSIKYGFKKEAEKIADTMMATAKAEAAKYALEARVLRNRPSSPLRPKDGNLMLYHQNRINTMLDGLSEEESINEFGYLVSILNDDERQYLHVYEDGLMAKMKDPVYKNTAEEVIFKFKSDKEKVAYLKAKKAEQEVKELETLAALIKDDIQNVASGEKIPTYSYHDLFEEVGTHESPDRQIKINPYDGENEPDSGEIE